MEWKHDSRTVNTISLQELVNYESGNFKVAHKVNKISLLITVSERQKVRTSAHVPSSPVGKAMKHLGKKHFLYSGIWTATAELIIIS